MARLTGIFVALLSTIIIIREFAGPTNKETFVKSLFWVAQFFFDLLQACMVSFQCVQILSIFHSETLSEWQDNLVVRIHRIIVIIFGGAAGILVCSMEAGMCRPTPLYFYLLDEHPVEQQLKYKSSFVSVISSLISFLIILVCQIAIETKRFLVSREEAKADRLVEAALKQMGEATSRLDRQPVLELGVDFLPSYVLRAWDDETSNRNIPRFNLSLLEHQEHSDCLEPVTSSASNGHAIKVARKGFFLGLSAAAVVVVFVSFDVMNRMRPHGTIAIIASTLGIFIPLTIILKNPKMKTFACVFITRFASLFHT